ILDGAPITESAGIISSKVSNEVLAKGELFSREIKECFVSDFEHPNDKMVHVSTFLKIDGTIYMSYYANQKDPAEDPKNQTVRLVYVSENDPDNKTYLDLQTTGSEIGGKKVDMVYDTVLMQKDSDTIYVMWTARVDENYYRFYCPFTLSTKTLGDIGVNRFKVKETVNDFSVSGIKSALSANNIPIKNMYSDIGIMQKLSSRVEMGEKWYYTGTYSGDFNCIIKSRDLITWEYVSQPDFINKSKWENAVYVWKNKCFYFVRQHDSEKYGFLTCYNLDSNNWEKPVLVEDCQSRSDFIVYNDELYLFHAPIDREHIGVIRIDTENLKDSYSVIQADMHGSCFYPFIQYYSGGELAMSYTVDRKHIRLAEFTLSRYS
ncbi:MAG: hypothetical protein ACI4XJ_10000, partial [Eubacteriales bacterium]